MTWDKSLCTVSRKDHGHYRPPQRPYTFWSQHSLIASDSFREDEAAAARSFPLPFNGELFNTMNFKCISLPPTMLWRGVLRQNSQISVAVGVSSRLFSHTTSVPFHLLSAAPQHGALEKNLSLRSKWEVIWWPKETIIYCLQHHNMVPLRRICLCVQNGKWYGDHVKQSKCCDNR